MLFDLCINTGSLWSIPLSCRERVSVLDPVVLQMWEKSILVVTQNVNISQNTFIKGFDDQIQIRILLILIMFKYKYLYAYLSINYNLPQ